MGQRPDTAGNIGALVCRVENDHTHLFGIETPMLLVEKIGNHERCRQHAMLQFRNPRQLVGTKTALDINEMRHVRAPVEKQKIGRIALSPAAVGVEAERAVKGGSFLSTSSLAAGLPAGAGSGSAR